MDIFQYYSEISEKHPEYVTQSEMKNICGISKTTAYKTEQQGVIPFEKERQNLLHFHKIRLHDVLAFKYKREYGYRDDEDYLSYLRQFYTRRLKQFSDILNVTEVATITGFNYKSVQRWLNRRTLSGFLKCRRYVIPKLNLIDFLVSKTYNAIQEKSEVQIATLTEFQTWYNAKLGGVVL